MSGSQPANLALQDPKLINLVTFLTMVQKEMRANANRLISEVGPALGGPSQQEIDVVREICEEAVSRSGQFDYFVTTQNNAKDKVLQRQGPWVKVAQMRQIVEANLYNNAPPAGYDLDDLRDGLRDFKSKWGGIDPVSESPNAATSAVMNTAERAARALDFVNRLASAGNPAAQNKPTVIVRDASKTLVDATYGAVSTCALVKEALFPLVDEKKPLSTQEAARQTEVAKRPLEAFELVVAAAAEAGTKTANARTVDVTPVEFMVDRFVRPDANRSDIFKAMDPKKAPGT